MITRSGRDDFVWIQFVARSFTELRPAIYRSVIQKVEHGSIAGSAVTLLSWSLSIFDFFSKLHVTATRMGNKNL